MEPVIHTGAVAFVDTTDTSVVEAYAIQAEEVLDKAGADLTDDLSVTNMKTIYDIFVKQSTSYDESKAATTEHDYNGDEKDANVNNSKDLHANGR